MKDNHYATLLEQLSNLNKNFVTHNQIMSVLLKFALDSSSFKSKTINEINASSKIENEILRAIHEGNK
tara:strand:- start:478 stop:681 length:204 start_codon:yes stop_codon:yes gene_type:complete